MDDSVLQKTKDTLGKVITKPPMTDKLLGRPPFRYLHDIIMSVVKTSGFYNGLYSAQEMDAKNIQDKDVKIAFLQKAIDTLSFTLGEGVKVKPSKVVAGHDPEKTNEFLQLLGMAILNKMDSTEGVERVLNGEKPRDLSGKGEKEKKKKTDKDKGATSSEVPMDKGLPIKEAPKERPGTVRSSRPKVGAEGVGPPKSKDKPKEKERLGKPPSKASVGTKSSKSSIKSSQSKGDPKSQIKEDTKDQDALPGKLESKEKSKEGRKHSGHSKPKEMVESSSKTSLQSKNQQKLQEGETGEAVSSRPVHKHGRKRRLDDADHDQMLVPSNEDAVTLSDAAEDEGLGSETKVDRPPSARGGRKRSQRPSKDHKTPAEVIESGSDKSLSPLPAHAIQPVILQRPVTGRPAPPRVVKREDAPDDHGAKDPSMHLGETPANVIMDASDDDDHHGIGDDENQFIVEDSAQLLPPHEQAFGNEEAMGDKPEGALTKNIVAMKEHLEGDVEKETKNSVYPTITEAQRRKEREIVAKEIEKLQGSIQILCKSANPLGKIMDYVQEDVDSMQKELEMWKVENIKHTEYLHREASITEQELYPLRALLEDLDAKIKEQEDMISATKSNILRHDVKTQQMLNTLTFGSS